MPASTHKLDQIAVRAIELASERHGEYATREHLLLALTDDPDAVRVMRACNVDIDGLRVTLIQYIEKGPSKLVRGEPADAKGGVDFERVLQRALLHVRSSGSDEVTGANILVALFSECDSYAVDLLRKQNMSRLDAVNYMAHGIAKLPVRTPGKQTSRPRA